MPHYKLHKLQPKRGAKIEYRGEDNQRLKKHLKHGEVWEMPGTQLDSWVEAGILVRCRPDGSSLSAEKGRRRPQANRTVSTRTKPPRKEAFPEFTPEPKKPEPEPESEVEPEVPSGDAGSEGVEEEPVSDEDDAPPPAEFKAVVESEPEPEADPTEDGPLESENEPSDSESSSEDSGEPEETDTDTDTELEDEKPEGWMELPSDDDDWTKPIWKAQAPLHGVELTPEELKQNKAELVATIRGRAKN